MAPSTKSYKRQKIRMMPSVIANNPAPKPSISSIMEIISVMNITTMIVSGIPIYAGRESMPNIPSTSCIHKPVMGNIQAVAKSVRNFTLAPVPLKSFFMPMKYNSAQAAITCIIRRAEGNTFSWLSSVKPR